MNPSGYEVTPMERTADFPFMKDSNYLNRRRTRMEASGAIANGGISVGKGGDQMRRLHIIYFLSRMGRIEQPHLIRVHHVHRNGVHLRDVKRWLADLRGKEMPEAFAWSFKRKYKNGYIWQDLMDDDLITALCDNEYVLKGSEIFPTSPTDASSFVATKACGSKANRKVQAEAHEDQQQMQEQDISNSQELEGASSRESYPSPRISTARKSSSEIYQESPVFSSDGLTITEAKSHQEEENNPDEQKSQEEQGGKWDNFSHPSSFYTILLGDKKNKKKKKVCDCEDNDNGKEKKDNPSSSSFSSSSSSTSSSSQSPFAKSRSYSSGTSKMLRNLLSCRAVDTNDSALVTINKSGSIKPRNSNNNDNSENEDDTKGSWNQQQHARRSFEGFRGSKKQQQQASDYGKPMKTVPAAYKPVGAPTCSQCGKSFNPEKLHAHMKSCNGMKAFTKAAAAANSHKKMQFHQSADPLYENQLIAIS